MRMHTMTRYMPALAALLLLALPACEAIAPDGGGPVEAKFTSLYGDYLSSCGACHSPGGAGATTPGIEKTLDFSSRATAYATLTTGAASGLGGNQSACNGAPLVVAGNPGGSLALAVIDEATRQAFDLTSVPGCDKDAISDMTLKTGAAPSEAFVTAFKRWISDGAGDN